MSGDSAAANNTDEGHAAQAGGSRQPEPNPPTHQSPRQQHSSSGLVKIRINGLNFATYFKHPDVERLVTAAHSFEMKFDHYHGGKMGYVNLVYENETIAKESFATIHKLACSNHAIKVQAPRKFYEPYIQQMNQHTGAQSPTVNENTVLGVDHNHPDLNKILYAYNLLPTADEKFLRVIFESDVISSIKIDKDPKKNDGSRIALLFFTEESAMKQAQTEYDNFSVDDGDVSRPMRLISLANHFKEMRAAKVSKTCSWETTSAGSSTPHGEDTHRSPRATSLTNETSSAPAAAAPKMSLNQVCKSIEEVLEQQRVNWAEVQDVKDLWPILDEVSRRHGWISDEQCRAAMLRVLGWHRDRPDQPDWMLDVIEGLIKSWQKELYLAEQRCEGEGAKPATRSDRQYVLSAPAYSPPSTDMQKPKKGGQKKGRHLLGVGALLSSAREAAGNDERAAASSPMHRGGAEVNQTVDEPDKMVEKVNEIVNDNVDHVDRPSTTKQRAKKDAHKKKPVVTKPRSPSPEPPAVSPQLELEDGEMAESDDETAAPGRSKTTAKNGRATGNKRRPLPPRKKRPPPSSSDSDSSDSDSDSNSSSDGKAKAAKRKKQGKREKKKEPSSDSGSSSDSDAAAVKPGMESMMPQMMMMVAQMAGGAMTPDQQAAMQGLMHMGGAAPAAATQARPPQNQGGYNYFVKSSQQ